MLFHHLKIMSTHTEFFGGKEECPAQVQGQNYSSSVIEDLRTYLTALDDVHIELQSYKVQLLWRIIRRCRHSVTRLTLADYLYYIRCATFTFFFSLLFTIPPSLWRLTRYFILT